MRKGIAILLGLILILFSAIKLLPFFGITVSVAGFSLDAWFPVVFMIIGLCELIINPSVNWLIGIAMIVLCGIDLVKNIGVVIPVLSIIDTKTMLLPAFIFIYGIKVLFTSK